jgi:hypothetical protein
VARARVCEFGDTYSVTARLLNFGIRVLADGSSIQIGAPCEFRIGCDAVIYLN